MREKLTIGWIDGGGVSGAFLHSMIPLALFEERSPSDRYEVIDYIRVFGGGKAESRNKIVDISREMGAEWIVQIDADHSFDSNLVRVLMRIADKDSRPIVTGLYSNTHEMREPTGEFQVHDAVYGEHESGGYQAIQSPDGVHPFRVDAFGTGVLLTHVSVYDTIPEPWYEERVFADKPGSRPVIVGEDISFCRKARECGYELWCDPAAECTHWKTLPLKPSTFRDFMQKQASAKEQLKRAAGG